MKIVIQAIPRITIEAFAEKHALTMEVHERRTAFGDPNRFYAYFASAEVMENGCLRSTFGNGATPKEAIADYARAISLKRLAIDAMTQTRREIDVPRLLPSTVRAAEKETLNAEH